MRPFKLDLLADSIENLAKRELLRESRVQPQSRKRSILEANTYYGEVDHLSDESTNTMSEEMSNLAFQHFEGTFNGRSSKAEDLAYFRVFRDFWKSYHKNIHFNDGAS